MATKRSRKAALSGESVYFAAQDGVEVTMPVRSLVQHHGVVESLRPQIAVFSTKPMQRKELAETRVLVKDLFATSILEGSESHGRGDVRVLYGEDKSRWTGLFRKAVHRKPEIFVTIVLKSLQAAKQAAENFVVVFSGNALWRAPEITVEAYSPEEFSTGSLSDWVREGEAIAPEQEKRSLRRLADERARILASVEMLKASDLASLAGSAASEPRAFAKRLRDTGAVLSVRSGEGFVYPEFQFDGRTGRPVKEMVEVLRLIDGDDPDRDGWRAMHWFCAQSGLLDGRRPCEIFEKDFTAVLDAARVEFAPVGRRKSEPEDPDGEQEAASDGMIG